MGGLRLDVIGGHEPFRAQCVGRCAAPWPRPSPAHPPSTPTPSPPPPPRAAPQVNKEAEHRERLQELQQRIAQGHERILSGEAPRWGSRSLARRCLPDWNSIATTAVCPMVIGRAVGAAPRFSHFPPSAHPTSRAIPRLLGFAWHRIAEEGFLADARKRHDELAADLEEVRWCGIATPEVAAAVRPVKRVRCSRLQHSAGAAKCRGRDHIQREMYIPFRTVARSFFAHPAPRAAPPRHPSLDTTVAPALRIALAGARRDGRLPGAPVGAGPSLPRRAQRAGVRAARVCGGVRGVCGGWGGGSLQRTRFPHACLVGRSAPHVPPRLDLWPARRCSAPGCANRALPLQAVQAPGVNVGFPAHGGPHWSPCCAAPQERDRDQELTDAHVDQRIRWVARATAPWGRPPRCPLLAAAAAACADLGLPALWRAVSVTVVRPQVRPSNPPPTSTLPPIPVHEYAAPW